MESGIRGGVATISHRHAKANNKYMGTTFDPTKDSKFISYLDPHNLYGWTMSKQLPTSGFEWMTDDELDDWKHLSCFLLDLEYPEDLHDLIIIIIITNNLFTRSKSQPYRRIRGAVISSQ